MPMELSLLTGNLRQAVQTAERATPTQAGIDAVQRHLKLTAADQQLHIAGSSNELEITAQCAAMIQQEGSICVPARLLRQLADSLPEDRADLLVQDDNPDAPLLTITCGASQVQLQGLPGRYFPVMREIESDTRIDLPASRLAQAINRTCFAAAKEQTRPVLTAVNLRIKGDRYTLAATDSFRMAIQYAQLPQDSAAELEVNLPRRTLEELVKLIEAADGAANVQVSLDPERGRARFQIDNMPVKLESTLVQGTYPEYEKLIPEDVENVAQLNRVQLLQAAKQAAIIARQAQGIIRLQIDPETNQVQIEAQAQDAGEITGSHPVVESGGNPVRIAFNCYYLQESLNAIQSDEVNLYTKGSNAPGTLRPAGDADYVQMIMPMFVQW